MKKILLLLCCVFTISIQAQYSQKETAIIKAELAKLVNQLREEKGATPLAFHPILAKAAAHHSKYMSSTNSLTHTESEVGYKTPFDRVHTFKGKDFISVGENVLYVTVITKNSKKEQLKAVAKQMFENWKDSPGHYANMVNPEYEFGDFGFEYNLKQKILFATQVFATKGVTIPGQLSDDDFGLTKASDDCTEAIGNLRNLVLNMGNALHIEGRDVVLYYHSKEYFEQIIKNPQDGLAVDLLKRDQFACGAKNQLDVSPVHDGILLPPVYKDELWTHNIAESDYRVIVKLGTIPEHLNVADYTPALILIKDGQACSEIYQGEVPSDEYSLRPVVAVTKDEPSVALRKEGIIQSQIINYDFNANQTKPVHIPKITKVVAPIHSIVIQAYSSVEGDSIHNIQLQNARAAYIQKQLQKSLDLKNVPFNIEAKEHWDLMDFQLNYFDRQSLLKVSHDSLKQVLANRDQNFPWDSLLFVQRKATAVVHYKGNFDTFDPYSFETLATQNFRTAVATQNVALANKTLYHMYTDSILYNKNVLFEPQVMPFVKAHRELVTNLSANLTESWNEYEIIRYMNHWLSFSATLTTDQKHNILQLYSLVCHRLLNNWDVAAERLAKVIHPSKIEPLIYEGISDELMLNLHLSFLKYYGQTNDREGINKSFNFIVNYFKARTLAPEDDNALVLFFNNWSSYNATNSYLLEKYQKELLDEDGLFIFIQTLNFSHESVPDFPMYEVHQKAISKNKERWCQWLQEDFQTLRNQNIKQLYCETCSL